MTSILRLKLSPKRNPEMLPEVAAVVSLLTLSAVVEPEFMEAIVTASGDVFLKPTHAADLEYFSVGTLVQIQERLYRLALSAGLTMKERQVLDELFSLRFSGKRIFN